jgi:phosphoadenosine phosphosulfate reductase
VVSEAEAPVHSGEVGDEQGGAAGGPADEVLAALAAADARLETLPPSKAIEWAVAEFGDDLVLAASFQDIVLIDLAVKVAPEIEVVFLDTEAHFPETLEFVEATRERYGLNLTVTKPGPEAADWPCGSPRCCEFRKVAPLRAALAGKRAWLTALKRSDAPTRAAAPVVGWDASFGLVKVNPMAAWTDDDIDAYLTDHDLPFHPLYSQGYRSIGCAPTTRPTAEGEDPRSGRWSGTGKTECGLHA